MTKHFGEVPAGVTLPIHFASYNSSNASASITGLAVTDIEIFKDGGATTRSSDAGYALIDTDGIDIASITGANGFTIDLSNNTDSGFFAVGSYYDVWVSTITLDSQTVSVYAASFRIRAAESSVGYANVTLKSGTGTGEVSLSSGAVLLQATQTGVTIPTVTNITNAPTSGDFTATMKTSIGTAVAASAVASVTAGVTLADDAITAAKFDETTAFPLKADDSGSTAVARTGADADTLETLSDEIAALPTATSNADALLNRDMSAVSDTNARSPLNALRFLRNKWAVATGTLTVTKEDDSTTAWTSTVSSDAAAEPIIGSDPA